MWDPVFWVPIFFQLLKHVWSLVSYLLSLIFKDWLLRIPPQRSSGKPYIWVDVSPYLKKNGSSFFPAIAMLVEPGSIYVNEQKLQHGPRFATMAIAAQAGFWRLRDWGLWDGFFQWWMLMEEIRILVETLEFLHGRFSMSTGALHRYESPKFWLGHASDLNFIWRIPRLFRYEIQAWEAWKLHKKLTANKAIKAAAKRI